MSHVSSPYQRSEFGAGKKESDENCNASIASNTTNRRMVVQREKPSVTNAIYLKCVESGLILFEIGTPNVSQKAHPLPYQHSEARCGTGNWLHFTHVIWFQCTAIEHHPMHMLALDHSINAQLACRILDELRDRKA